MRGECLMLIATGLLFGAAFIYFYPLTLRLRYRQGRAELAWLPRVWGGFARPLILTPKLGNSKKPLPGRLRAFWRRRRLYRRLFRRLYRRLGHLELLLLEGRLELRPQNLGGTKGELECIFQLPLGHIIGDSLYALWLLKRGGKNVQRA